MPLQPASAGLSGVHPFPENSSPKMPEGKVKSRLKPARRRFRGTLSFHSFHNRRFLFIGAVGGWEEKSHSP
jgi:hypothetical protein